MCALATAMAFLDHHVLSMVRRLPLSLTQGDVLANLESFAALPLQERWGWMSKKIWHCVQWAIHECANNLELLVETALSTKLCEDAHAAAAVAHRFHPRIGTNTLETRAYFGDTRALVERSRLAARLLKLHDELDLALRSSRNIKYSAQNAFLGAFWKQSKGMVGTRSEKALAGGSLFRKFGDDDKHQLVVAAEEERCRRISSNAGSVAATLSQLKLLQAQIASNDASRGDWHLH